MANQHSELVETVRHKIRLPGEISIVQAEAALDKLVEQYGTVRDALIDHLQTHNGAPGNPEPLCACESCKLGRAALSNPSSMRDGDPIEGRPGWSWSESEGRPVWNQETEPHECPYCDGRGWNTTAVHDPTDPDGEPLPEQEQCATCGGSGEVSRPAKRPDSADCAGGDVAADHDCDPCGCRRE